MDAKEIDLRGKAINKASQNGDPPGIIINLLNELKSGVQITEELLRSTRIGFIVNKLKQHKDPAVARQAGELVSKWRTDVKKAGSGSSSGGKATGTAAATSPSTTTNGSATATGQKPKHNVAPENRNSRTDKVDTNLTGSAIRDNCLRLMYDGLALMSEDMPADVLHIARAIEVEAYSVYQPETSEAYKSKMRSLYQNLKNKSNPQLRKRLLSGEILPARFVVMSLDELKSAERRAEDERLQKENMDKAMVAQEEKSISASLECGRCKQRKVSYSQAQTRSADEPMTTFCECTVCGNRWKFS